MWFVRVDAHSFGPFRDRHLEFSQGLNVIYGENASGKSSWHHALYLAFCGIRRASGLRKEEKELADRHRPWDDGTAWKVSTQFTRDSGQQIEITQNLLDKVDCRALDRDVGTDLSSSMIDDGSPSGAVLLGLDRRSFRATALVEQNEILSVIQHASSLQDQLQRAAASAGVDQTTAEALSRIDEFLSEQVGLDRANSTKPLRIAKNKLEEAKERAHRGHLVHEDYLAKTEELDKLQRRAADSEQRLNLVEAARARLEARRAREDVNRARELSDKYPARPSSIAGDAKVAQAVAAALDGWDKRPVPRVLEGETADQLRQQLVPIPSPQEGDQQPHASVVAAHLRYQQDALAVKLHASNQPPYVVDWASTDSKPRQIRAIQNLTSAFIIVMMVVGLGLLRSHPDVSLPLIGVGLVALGLLLISVIRRNRQADASLVRIEALQQNAAAWNERNQSLTLAMMQGGNLLRERLRERGLDADMGIEQLYERYSSDCLRRKDIAEAWTRRSELETKIAARAIAEQTLGDSQKRLVEAGAFLRNVAEQCGMKADTEEQLASQLLRWQLHYEEKVAAADRAQQEWGELEGLLKGRSLRELERLAAQKGAHADAVAGRLGGIAIPEAAYGENPDQEVERLRTESQSARRAAEQMQGKVDELSKNVQSVVDLDEQVSRLATELNRITDLERTLKRTQEFLEAAQVHVHRNVARILAAALRQSMPHITRGRYDDAMVDPETLAVKVRSGTGPWRDAMWLSRGTAEQIYLLLRLAMADYLTKASGDTCPLILDDATTQCDSVRTYALLELLHELSARRQIILFTQQSEVLAWAHKHLAGGRDKLHELDASIINA